MKNKFCSRCHKKQPLEKNCAANGQLEFFVMCAYTTCTLIRTYH